MSYGMSWMCQETKATSLEVVPQVGPGSGAHVHLRNAGGVCVWKNLYLCAAHQRRAEPVGHRSKEERMAITSESIQVRRANV